jgi:hypothetical protein
VFLGVIAFDRFSDRLAELVHHSRRNAGDPIVDHADHGWGHLKESCGA